MVVRVKKMNLEGQITSMLHPFKKWKKTFADLFVALVTAGILSAFSPSLEAKKTQSERPANRLVIPGGTDIEVKMIDELNTGTNHVGDPFQASLTRNLLVAGKKLAAKDDVAHGKIIELTSSGRLKGPAAISLKLTHLTLSDGRRLSLETSPYSLDGKSHALRNASLIGGGAAAGAVLGGIAGRKKGVLIGSAVGAGAGTATAYLTGKQEIVIPAETNLSFTTADSVSIRAIPSERDSSQSESRMLPRDKDGRIGRVDIIFSDRDRRIIRDYFKGRYSNLPPGLAKRGGHLPPGLEKQLERNGKLPPGLQKRVEPFPRDLEIRLPRLPDRIVRIVLGRRAMIVDEQYNILDMIEDIRG